jgi:glycosyltransferase involved in cell wall biosynthesis
MPQEHDSRCRGARHCCVHYLGRVRLQEGGVARALLDICLSLAVRGHSVTLLTEDPTDVPPEWQRRAQDLPRALTIPAPRPLRALPIEAESAIRAAHVLHLHTPWGISNLALARCAKRWQIPYIVSIHGMLDGWSLRQKWLKKWLFLRLAGRRFLAGATRVHCTAAAELAQAGRFISPGRGVVIPCPVDLDPFTELPGPEQALSAYPELKEGAPRILFLSRLHPKKRPDLLIEAAAMLERAGEACQLILAGPGDAAYVAGLEQLALRRGLARRVLFTGMVHGLMKMSLFQAADVFVLPTSQENFGIVIVEAMAAGTPVVTTRGVDIWQELRSAGAVIVDQDAACVASAIRSLVGDLPGARKRGQQGREWVFREFNAERIIGAYERLYDEASRIHARAFNPLAASGS